MPFRLSTRGHYAVLRMYELARSSDDTVSLADVSSMRNISQGYLEQIIKPLRLAGLVSGRKGFGGGYSLSKAPADVTVGDVIRAVEGPVVPVKCAVVDSANLDDHCPSDCSARTVWQRVGQAIDRVLDSITLQDLLSGDIDGASRPGNEE